MAAANRGLLRLEHLAGLHSRRAKGQSVQLRAAHRPVDCAGARRGRSNIGGALASHGARGKLGAKCRHCEALTRLVQRRPRHERLGRLLPDYGDLLLGPGCAHLWLQREVALLAGVDRSLESLGFQLALLREL